MIFGAGARVVCDYDLCSAFVVEASFRTGGAAELLNLGPNVIINGHSRGLDELSKTIERIEALDAP